MREILFRGKNNTGGWGIKLNLFMTTKELIKELKKLNPDAKVLIYLDGVHIEVTKVEHTGIEHEYYETYLLDKTKGNNAVKLS